jgi:Family of unknown function (DUF6174)
MLRLSRGLAAAVLSLSALAACAPQARSGDPDPPPPPTSAAQGDLAAARQLWASQETDDYRYRFSRQCFCLGRGPVVVEVRDGRVASVRDAESGGPPAEDAGTYVLTVEQLFERIAEAQRGGEATSVSYDPVRGFPVRAEIGSLAADAGVVYEIGELAPLQ